ncbi:MAG: hypothetical protein LBU36_04420 [Clostridiales bacterium]|jgi:hypothetical protein|nr:hypothetical protein [Clostridiales bacterium]
MLILYDRDESGFSGNGLAALNLAFSVRVLEEINGPCELSFSYPAGDPKAALITRFRVVKCEGRLFRVSRTERAEDGRSVLSVTANHIYDDCKNFHIREMPEVSGAGAQELFALAFAGTGFNVLPSEFNPVVDFTGITDATPDEAAQLLIKCAGRGEIFKDNKNVALVERLGADKRVPLRLDYNVKELKRFEDCSGIITRLYPYGRDDLTIEGGYIDSPDISLYGVREGSLRYREIGDAAALLARASLEFSPANPGRIDAPGVSFQAEFIDREGGLSLGDSVLLDGEALRVSRLIKYPYESVLAEITAGRPKRGIAAVIGELERAGKRPPKVRVTQQVINEIRQDMSLEIHNAAMEVFKTETLSAETAQINAAWIRELYVQWLETNFEAIDPRRPYPAGGKRPFIRVHNQNIEHFISDVSEEEVEDFKLPSGQQVYYTSIEAEEAFKYFTVTDPVKWNAEFRSVTEENAPEYSYLGAHYESLAQLREAYRENFRVKARKQTNMIPRKTQGFNMNGLNEPWDVWGRGDEAGNGCGYQYKDLDGFNLIYTSRGAAEIPPGFEIGLKLRDDGVYTRSLPEEGWVKLGAGGAANIVFLNRAPEAADIAGAAENTLFVQYAD